MQCHITEDQNPQQHFESLKTGMIKYGKAIGSDA